MTHKRLLITAFLVQALLVLHAQPVDKWHRLYGNHTIFIETDYKYNWHKAWNECAMRNMNLIAVDTANKSAALTNLLRRIIGTPLNLWLGGNDLADEGTFVWSSTGKRFEFTNWFGLNPDNWRNIEHCVHIWENTDLEWNDANCVQKMGFICEAKHEYD